MRTADSSTDSTERGFGKYERPHPVASAVRAAMDVVHLLRFRSAHSRRGMSLLVVGGLFAVTAAAAVIPAYTPGAGTSNRSLDLLVLLPTVLAGYLVLAIIAAAASGGGRELIGRDPGSIHPLSPTTDHLGALLLAPLNIAWLIQAWSLLGVTAYALGPDNIATAQPLILLWLAFGTALAQVLAWTLEGVRRVPHGIVGVRLLNVVVFGVALGLQLSNNVAQVFDRLPTLWFVVGMNAGFSWRWAITVGVVLVAFVFCVVLGAVPATIAAHRVPRDELKVETGQREPRAMASSVLGAMIRVDRGSVWRAVPMRRGLVVLAVGPGVVALLGDLQWGSMTILPGLVASGGALLYGVNAWCLDSRGALWRESLPVPASTVFDARAYVLAEFLLAASFLTVAVAGLRAGLPTAPQMMALVATLLVVTTQVVAAAMRWSAARPFAVDLRSSRATPAPPARMVAYSSRLALSTTVTGLIFSALSEAPAWQLSALVAVPMLAWSFARLLRARRAWMNPYERARVITTVAVA